MARSERARNEEEQDIFLKTWTDSYAEVSKMWEDTYLNLQKPWIETTGELLEKAADLSKEATPKQYEEFYDEWMKAYRKNFGKAYPFAAQEADKEILENLTASAEESIKLYKSWIDELEKNAQKTKKVLQGAPDSAEYRENYDVWMKSYKKIFDEFLGMASMENTKDILEKYTGVPDIYFGSFVQIAKLWRSSYAKLYEPWIDAVSKLSAKMAELSTGKANPEAYKEFYALWTETYKETYGKYVQGVQPPKEIFDSFVHSTDTYLNMYKSWIVALEKMAEKTNQLSQEAADPEVSREFYLLWIQMYEKAFGSFFDDMPMEGPMRQMLEPVKLMAEINADTFARMSKMWIKDPNGRD